MKTERIRENRSQTDQEAKIIGHFVADILHKIEPKQNTITYLESKRNSIEILESHGVLPLLGSRLGRLQQYNCPENIIKAISIAQAANAQIVHQRCIAARKVFGIFYRNRIDALIFKGAANAYLLYEKPMFREHADIDILIQEKQFQAVRQVFIDNGFSVESRKPTLSGPYQATATLVQQGKPAVSFDIHWRINNRTALAEVIDFEELARNALDIEVYGKGARGLGYSDALLVACIHEAGALPQERNRLISLCDIHLLMEKLGSEGIKSCAGRAIEKGIGEIFIYCIELAAGTFGDERQRNMVIELKSVFEFDNSELSARLLVVKRSWLEDQLLDLKAVDGLSAKIGFFASKLARKFGRV